MTSVRAKGSLPTTAASSELGVSGLPVDFRAALGAPPFAGLLDLALAGSLFAAARLAAAASRAGRAAARGRRDGYFDGANSKLTFPASWSQTRKALNARRVRFEMNFSSRSVLPVSSS